MADLRAAAEAHRSLFNAAVTSGDFAPFLATFAEDAVMRFEQLPFGPFVGREEIARAYAERPPTDTMTVLEVVQPPEPAPDDDTALVRFVWDHGGTGRMRVRWRAGEVVDLTIAFDRSPAPSAGTSIAVDRLEP